MYLVSACLLGLNTRFNGKRKEFGDPLAVHLNELVPICPEQLGGLPTPRLPAEIQGINGGEGVLAGEASVFNAEGKNVTGSFLSGARETLYLARLYRVKGAFLKDGSPSCGSSYIYNGTFSCSRCPGKGVTAALLALQGIPLFNEKDLFRRNSL